MLNFGHRAGTPSRFCIGSLKSVNSVGNINKAKSLQKNRKHFASRRKGSSPLGPGSCLYYTFVILDLIVKKYLC